MSSDDGGFVEIPDDIFDEQSDEATLVPVFVGHRMEAELIRSLLEANELPAVVFGMGGFAFGAEDAGPNERVMVRSDHHSEALRLIREADVSNGGIVEGFDETVIEELVVQEIDEQEGVEGTDAVAEDYHPDDVPVLAGGSDWGPRIAGLIGVAALVTTIIVILQKG